MRLTLDRIGAWTFHRQFLERDAGSPREALRGVVGVYSSHPTAPLSLAARCRSFSPSAFVALETERNVVRLPAMRGSVFLLATQDAPRIFSATREPVEKFAGSLKYAGVTLEDYARLKRRVLDALRDPLTPEELRSAVKTDLNLTIIARVMSREGLTVRVSTSLRTDALRYVSTRAWLGEDLRVEDPERALQWLAREYLRAFGPARPADFAWWCGSPKKRAAAAIGTVQAVDLGDGLLLLREDEAAVARQEKLGADVVAALPKWDALTMAYAPDGRSRFLDDSDLGKAYTGPGGAGATTGDGRPLLLRGGRAVAAWSHRIDRDSMAIEIAPFGRRIKGDAYAGVLSQAAAAIGVSHVTIPS